VKYVLMFVDRPDLQTSVPPEHAEKVYAQMYEWFGEHQAAGHIAEGGAELQPPTTATTVRSGGNGSGPVVVDGPFSEAKEVIGGFTIIEAPDLDGALGIARTWPGLTGPGVSVEVRPIVDHSSDM